MHLYRDAELAAVQCTNRGVVYRLTFLPDTAVDWARTQVAHTTSHDLTRPHTTSHDLPGCPPELITSV